MAQAHPKVVVSTSASPAEGKTTVAVALASSFARQGYRTLLVDLDMRKPMVATLFGLGYGDVRADVELSETEGPIKAFAMMLDKETILDVVPVFTGVDRPAERIAAGIGLLLARAREEYDVIVFDAAPVMAVADALPVAAVADTLPVAAATVVAVRLTGSNRRQLANTLDVLRRAGATLAGTVVAHASSGSRAEGGAYGYGYGYGEASAAAKVKGQQQPKPDVTQPA